MHTEDKQGFSSEEQINLQTVEAGKITFLDQHQKEKVRIHAMRSIHPAEEIKKKQYSLEPDMLTGWKPKTYIPKPIPLIFYNDHLDYAIQTLIKMKTFKHEHQDERIQFIELVYLGPRYESTYSAWYQKPFDFPYTHLNKNKRLKFTDREFVGQYWHAQTQNHLHFDSFFQSANLDVVFKIGQLQYDLFMRVDSNTRGHLQWYNFKVKNMKKGQLYKFNICNFLKAKSLYTRGMKPFVFSKRKYEFQKVQWQQSGENVKYQKKTPKSFKICKTQIQQKPYRLSFQYECLFQNDEIQFAYCIPYEYSRLKQYLEKLETRCAGRNILKVSRLAYSLGGLDIPILTITTDLKEKTEQEDVKKKLVVASGRIHPGESNGSFMIQGFIEHLCSDTEEGKLLRDNLVFKIIPMVNPDGVVLGNYRTSLSGKDLNRQFINPDQYVFPQNYHLKKCIFKLRHLYKKSFLMYLDFHGHSTKKIASRTVHNFQQQTRIITNVEFFQNQSQCKRKCFVIFHAVLKFLNAKKRLYEPCYQSTLIWIYTIQVSNGCFYNHEDMEDVKFDQEKWLQMGKSIGKGVEQYVCIMKELESIRNTKRQERLLKSKQNKERYRVKNNSLLKRDQKSIGKDKDKISLSGTKASLNIKCINNQASLFGSFSPSKPRKLNYPNFMSVLSQTNLKNCQNTNQPEFQPDIQIPELKDQKLNMILQSIYRKNPQKSLGKEQYPYDKSFLQKFQAQSNRSDDKISQGGSDSSQSDQDLNQQFKKHLFKSIKAGAQKVHSYQLQDNRSQNNPNKDLMKKINQNDEKDSDEQNETFVFMTQMGDSNQLQEIQKMDKINSIKMNQLRSKRRIYLKKKSYQLNMTPSPKRQQKSSQAAKIINFQFSLQPIKATNHVWHQKQQNTNSIHSLIKQNSEQRFQPKTKQPPLVEYMTRTSSQIRDQSRFQDYSQNFRKTFLSVQRQMQIAAHSSSSSKINNMSLLRKTQQRKPIINATFYRNFKPSKNIEDDNVKGKRIFSSDSRRKSKTEVFED